MELLQSDDDFTSRRLCPDGSCTGIIGPDGRCTECGTLVGFAEGDLPPSVREPSDQKPKEVSNLDAISQATGSTTLEDRAAKNEPIDTDDDFARRRLCPDGSCTGIIGPDGRCTECGMKVGD